MLAGRDDFTVRIDVNSNTGIERTALVNALSRFMEEYSGGWYVYQEESKIARTVTLEVTAARRRITPVIILPDSLIRRLEQAVERINADLEE